MYKDSTVITVYRIASPRHLLRFSRRWTASCRVSQELQVFLGDILVAEGPHHLSETVRKALVAFRKNDICPRADENELSREQVVHLANQNDGDELDPSEHKVEAIMKAPTSWHMRELRSFLGFIGY